MLYMGVCACVRLCLFVCVRYYLWALCVTTRCIYIYSIYNIQHVQYMYDAHNAHYNNSRLL